MGLADRAVPDKAGELQAEGLLGNMVFKIVRISDGDNIRKAGD